MVEQARKQVGMVGLYDSPDALLRAARMVRDAGYRRWDCHTPYPVHGLDKAMGLRPSPVPYVTLSMGLVGFLVALALTGGLNVFHYPLRVGGKPLFSWPAFVPIYFEMFVLFAAVSTMGSLIWLCGLGRWHSPLHDSDVMRHVTCDRFAIVLDGRDEKYTDEGARKLLAAGGCPDIRPLMEFDEEDEAII